MTLTLELFAATITVYLATVKLFESVFVPKKSFRRDAASLSLRRVLHLHAPLLWFTFSARCERKPMYRSTIDYTAMTVTAQRLFHLIVTGIVCYAIHTHVATAVSEAIQASPVERELPRKMSGTPWTRTGPL